jgi:hypothetical protein
VAVKNLLVGSVFANDSPLQQKWLDLQMKYLAATTVGYDHVVVLSEPPTSHYFSDRTKVLTPHDTSLKASDAHVQGLEMLTGNFLARRSDYANFLYLDGDAFPIRKQWLGTLLSRMTVTQRYDAFGVPFPSTKGREYEIAVAVRSENLERRWHASVLFAKNSALDHLRFCIGLVGDDIAGNPEEDVHIPVYEKDRKKFAYPLVRTNQFNIHPLAFGVYYDMFYHHCCGSGRWFNLRAKEYYDRIVIPVDDLSPYTEALFRDPNAFVSKLAGWNPARYGVV